MAQLRIPTREEERQEAAVEERWPIREMQNLKISKGGLSSELTESSLQGALVGGGGSVLGLGSDIGGRQVSLFPSNSGISSRYKIA